MPAFNGNKLQLREMIRTLDHGALLYRPSDKLFICNEAFRKIVSAAPGSGDTLEPDQLLSAIASAFEKESELREELREKLESRQKAFGIFHKSKKGQLILINLSFFQMDDSKLLLATFSNLTEINDAIILLQKQEEKYRVVVENMNLGVLEVDSNGSIVEAYPKFCEMTGYQREELIGRNAAETFLLPEDNAIMRNQESLRKKGVPGIYEIRLRRKDGRIIWMLISGTSVYDDKGRVCGSFGIHMDITPMKATEAALLEKHQKLVEAKKAKESLMANLSHEMRTPINGILGIVRLILAEHKLDTETRNKLLSLKKTAGHLQYQVEELLDYAILEKGGMRIEEQPFHLLEVLEIIRFYYAQKAEESRNEFHFEYDDSIPETLISDPIKIGQALRQLLDNAFKFCPKARITLRAQKLRSENGKTEIELSVSDTGPGIPRKELRQIFNAFYRLEQKGMISEGMGIGLPMARLIIEKLGGELELRSREGKGTDALIYLSFEGSTEEERTGQMRKKPEEIRILAAEDNEINTMIVKEYLSRWGFQFDLVDNGQEVLDKLREYEYDLILMDIQMPGLSGLEAAKIIRKEFPDDKKDIPILALTAYAYNEDREKCLEAGMNDYISKPFTPIQLFHKISSLIPVAAENGERSNTPASDSKKDPDAGDILDIESLRIFTRNDSGLQESLVKTFIKDAPKVLSDIKTLMEKRQMEELGKVIHKIKPSIAVMGIKKAIPLVEALNEKLKEEGRPEELEGIMQEFIAAYQEGVASLEQLLL